jgi:hypothetical protein
MAGRRLRARLVNSMPFMFGIMTSENKTAMSALFAGSLVRHGGCSRFRLYFQCYETEPLLDP